MTLRDRLVRYLQNNPGFIAKGTLEELVVTKTNFTADNCGRRLRELAEEKIIEVKQIKNHAHYRISQEKTPEQLRLESLDYFDSLAVK